MRKGHGDGTTKSRVTATVAHEDGTASCRIRIPLGHPASTFHEEDGTPFERSATLSRLRSTRRSPMRPLVSVPVVRRFPPSVGVLAWIPTRSRRPCAGFGSRDRSSNRPSSCSHVAHSRRRRVASRSSAGTLSCPVSGSFHSDSPVQTHGSSHWYGISILPYDSVVTCASGDKGSSSYSAIATRLTTIRFSSR